MTDEIKSILEGWDADLEPIKQQSVTYFDDESKIREDNAIQIYRRPWVAPQNFGLLLFPPAQTDWLTEFEKITGKAIPTIYKTVLLQINGCFVYDFSLFGLPASVYTTGLLNRGVLQQFDLTEANSSWIREYDVDQSLFHFGGRAYSDDENIGYFIGGDEILSVRPNGEIVNSYTSIRDFLKNEIDIAEQMMLTHRQNKLL